MTESDGFEGGRLRHLRTILLLAQRVWLSGYRIFMMGRGFYTPRIWQRVDFQTDEEKAG